MKINHKLKKGNRKMNTLALKVAFIIWGLISPISLLYILK